MPCWLARRWRYEDPDFPVVASRPVLPHGQLSVATSDATPPPPTPAPSFLMLCPIQDESVCFGTQQTIVSKTIRKIGKHSGCHSPVAPSQNVPPSQNSTCVFGVRWPSRQAKLEQTRRNKRAKEKGWGQTPQKEMKRSAPPLTSVTDLKLW